MNCIEARNGLLIEFEDNRKLQQFKDYAKRKNIVVFKVNETANLIVVDVKSEKEAYEFTFM